MRYIEEVPIIDLSVKIAESKAIIERFLELSKKPMIAFSGGKDSLVAAYLATQYGIKTAFCEHSYCFDDDLEDYKRSAIWLGLNCAFNSEYDWDWLEKNQQFILPDTMKQQGEFYKIRHQKTIARFAKQNECDGILFGRRDQENSIKSELYMRKQTGVWQCHPLKKWTTQEVWSFIRQTNMPYPRIYDHIIGRYEGATPWILMNKDKLKKGGYNAWDLIYDKQKDIVEKAAKFHIQAQIYLTSMK